MKSRFLKILFVLFSLALFMEDCNKEKNALSIVVQNQSLPELASATMPKPDHIVIVIEENHSYRQIIGSDSAPYINVSSGYYSL